MTPPTIHQLRARGFKVRVMHERVTSFTYHHDVNHVLTEVIPNYTRVTKEGKQAKSYPHLHEKGGRTTVEVTTPTRTDGGYPGPVSESVTATCSLKDPFNRKRGNLICLGRLQKRGVI